MYAIDKPTPRRCRECPEFVKIEIAYDDPIGCVHNVKGADKTRKDRPVECVLIDQDDDYK